MFDMLQLVVGAGNNQSRGHSLSSPERLSPICRQAFNLLLPRKVQRLTLIWNFRLNQFRE